jgi:hypothetical protein
MLGSFMRRRMKQKRLAVLCYVESVTQARLDRAHAALLVAVLVSNVACSNHSAAPEGPASDASADAGPSITTTLSASIQPNGELYSCTFVALPAQPLFITGFDHTFSVGYHHLYVYETDLTTLPPGAGTATDCYAGTANPMTHARGNLYAQEVTSGSFSFPPGVALPTTAGQVVLIQAHYLNATAQAIDASATLSIFYSSTDPGQHAATFFFYDPFIDVGPQGVATASMRCLVPSSLTVLTTMATAHQRAIGYEAFLDTPTTVGANPYYHAPGWSDSLPLVATLPIDPGSHLRFLCTYDNSGPTEYLQGTLASTSEQCILSGLYFPEIGPEFDECQSPDELGTGKADCVATQACVDACPAGSAPPANLGLGGEPAIDPCWQRCIVASCPDTSALLFALRACVAAHCASSCGGVDAGDAGTACTTCEKAQCSAESTACSGDPCH